LKLGGISPHAFTNALTVPPILLSRLFPVVVDLLIYFFTSLTHPTTIFSAAYAKDFILVDQIVISLAVPLLVYCGIEFNTTKCDTILNAS
jgi:hypothetical protein